MSGRLGVGLGDRRNLLIISRRLRFAPQSSLHAVSDARRQFVRPERNGLWRDANRISGSHNTSAELADGISFFHAQIKACFVELWQACLRPTKAYFLR